MAFEFEEWVEIYKWIAGLLGIDPSSDEMATKVLSKLLGDNYVTPEYLRRVINGRYVVVFGAGPSLVDHVVLVKKYLYGVDRGKIVLIAANGATKALLERGLVPNIIVTDLDGDLMALAEAGSKGSILVVHGHGDNIELLRKYIPLFSRRGFKIHGTTQVKPVENVFNYYGFTDGDRAVYMAAYYRASRIILAGMDLGPEVGVYSGKDYRDKPGKLRGKLVKLSIARELLKLLSLRIDIPIYTLSEIHVGAIVKITSSTIPIILRW